ncbi:MAG: alpha/beta fold hydrolase [Rhodomicrobium sp.]
MVASWLRWKIAIELIGVFLAAHALGAGAAYAAALSAAGLFALHCASMLVTFAIAWPRGCAGREAGFAARCRTIAAECLAYFALFAVIQPFDRLFMRSARQELPPANRMPVLFVHGYFCNRGLWWRTMARLRGCGVYSRAVSLEPPLASIDALAAQLDQEIEAYLEGRASDKLILVTHSMGGLVARAYLKRHGSARVGKLITLACPHHGTRIAALGLGRNAREMEPGSAWLGALAASQTIAIPFVNVWSAHDNFVTPQTAGRLAGAQEIVLGGLGHLSFVFSERVFAILLRELS